ncbi:unnamed protein product [Bursaphelenchus okinawaensis]|uniref:Uncharacterized protein n=1 Tax=Bursaphelenchus okinawaensis TaxID=465554 RepID=A0A811LM57_9BILA|nr:unnamed protein product [Bursaphelenchus okinawaensis]CAG9125007.1 unnamed protein product [Bursaphelenchus okinawaensis]
MGQFRKKSMDKTLLKHNGNLPKITMTTDDAPTTQPVFDNRKQSTGTLNRLILVAQALEHEVDSRRRSDINGSRIILTIRMANMVLLILVNVLIFTGVGQYQGRNGMRQSLMLTANKWTYKKEHRLPFTFSEMKLTGQYVSGVLSAVMLCLTLVLQLVHCFKCKHSKLMCICYSFGCVPFSLLVFGLEMHYSACPWLDDFYRSEILRRDFNAVEKYFDTQCGINGWALAGIFSLLSCGLFVSEGLITAFFRSGEPHDDNGEKSETIL